jgi:hypothetical protein
MMVIILMNKMCNFGYNLMVVFDITKINVYFLRFYGCLNLD